MFRTVGGEAVLNVGKCIDFINKGASGILTIMPFAFIFGTKFYL
jgi:predicted nucleotide-binding protein (sugar kinase/HSP70/actin superfamily)